MRSCFAIPSCSRGGAVARAISLSPYSSNHDTSIARAAASTHSESARSVSFLQFADRFNFKSSKLSSEVFEQSSKYSSNLSSGGSSRFNFGSREHLGAGLYSRPSNLSIRFSLAYQYDVYSHAN
jgi:hypothetical protein